MRITLPLDKIAEHSARMRKFYQERDKSHCLTAELTRALEDEALHYVEVVGPRMNAQLRGVTTLSCRTPEEPPVQAPTK